MTKLKDDQKVEIIKLRNSKKTLLSISKLYGVSEETIRRIVGNTGHIVTTPKDGFIRCYRCKREKPNDEFYFTKKKNSTSNSCKLCLKKHSRIWGKIYSYKYKIGGIYFERRRARQAVSYAIARGNLYKGSCYKKIGCSGRIEAHHYLGYDKEHWLDVMWVCSKHHRKLKDQL